MSIRNLTLVGSLTCAILPTLILAIGSLMAIRAWTFNEEVDRATSHAHYLGQLLEQNLSSERRGVEAAAAAIGLFDAPSTAEITGILTSYREAHPMIDSALFIDLRGRVSAAFPAIADDGKSRIGADVSDRAYFREAVGQEISTITRDILLGKVSQRRLAILATPVYDANNTLIGVAAGTLWVRDLREQIEQFGYGATGQAAVVTEAGSIIAHGMGELSRDRQDITDLPIWTLVNQSESGPLQDYSDAQGRARFGGYATVPSVGWKIWVSRNSDEIEQVIVDSYLSEIIWVALAIALSVALSVFLTRLIANPLDVVRQTTTRIAGGELSHRAPEQGAAEVIELATSVNRMAAELERNIMEERESKASLERSVEEFASLAGRVASGDLTARVSEDHDGALGELGGSLNRMTESLAGLVSDIQDAVKHIASASSEILAATSQQVSATAEEATAVRQTAATVSEVRQASELATRKARTVSEMSQKMANTAESGRTSVEESIQSSDASKQQMEALAERILAFSEQAEAIAEINATVGELAEQSNLLAVNAGIEAAKAGEAGKGFAFVAGEVKALAERSKEATVQVRKIVVDLQKSAQSTVIAAEQGVKAAESGADAAKRSGESIGALSTSVTDASQAAQQIMATSQQHEAGMDQIVAAIQDIEQSSAQTVSAMQQVEAAAKDLNQLAQRLSDNVRSSIQSD
ncbi:methyl-accepting chemotaxis protein [Marivibrio halodurans]|uniref:Methyl-accepting chemotaxis protein n=1 Tax=Marivibrio halodurans TaxID=2039722 RepID=A0A8J7S007_9PROT|nr:methyl-accepting chemotaxis protein [Marivibrio halodurans]MBP5856184.1 methyl-accepting chemotaxis protein [Marivibrio halodurans]